MLCLNWGFRHSLLQEDYTEALPALFNSDGDVVFTIDPPPKPP